MKTISRIIELLGGLEALRENSIKIENAPFMPLCIEYVGDHGPCGYPLLSVFHFYVQNGDLMMDPEMVFEISPANVWLPVSYRQDGLGLVQEAVWEEDGKIQVNSSLVKSLKTFAKLWDRNLEEQGFVVKAAS